MTLPGIELIVGLFVILGLFGGGMEIDWEMNEGKEREMEME